MRIKTSSFCGLSRHKDWQEWLRIHAFDLLASLDKTIKSRQGCKANSEKMMDVYHEVYKRGLGAKLEQFIQDKFPWLVEDGSKPSTTDIRSKARDAKIRQSFKHPDAPALNKHKVFVDYRPNLLGFPQKLILVGTSQAELLNKVQAFVKDKVGVDYIIIDDRAYIEFFEPKFSSIVDRLKRESRDIYKYRQRQKQSAQSNPDRESK